ncbi:MAG: hypothetical protein K9L65_16120 [Chromatiaceae bacterium]|nr:hypothetical protein [Chromatiaceae bacterium]
MDLQTRHWLIALLLAVVLHAALALALVPRLSSSPTAEPVAIVLELGMSGYGRPAGGDGEPAGVLAAVGPAAAAPVVASDASIQAEATMATTVAVTELVAATAEEKEATTPPETGQRPIPARCGSLTRHHSA